MIRESKITKEVTVKQHYCDICGSELHWFLACSVARCSICGRDLCNNCIGNEENDYGDYRHVWCKRCWEIGEPYRKKIELLEKRIHTLYEQWRKDGKSTD